MDDDKALSKLAGEVSDGTPVDWDDAERRADGEAQRGVVRNLRLLESVARAHRSQSAGRDPLGMTGSVRAAELRPDVSIEETIQGDPEHGLRWGGLEIRERIGAGAFGDVYRAWDPNLDREVALKLLKPGPSALESVASTVIREGRLLARVAHPNVVTVHGAEVHDDRVGVWMEFVPGQSLEELLTAQGAFGEREAASIGIDLCRALAAVHRAGLVHRDIKGRNVMREQGGRILLMDFGAGLDLTAGEASRERSISGTPMYIAPEIFAGADASPRSDIYSLGVLLFHLVTARFPFDAGSLDELVDKKARHEQRLLRDARPDLAPGFVQVVEKAMSSDPAARYASVGRMERDLLSAIGAEREDGAAPVRPLWSRPWAWASGVVLLSLVVASLALVQRGGKVPQVAEERLSPVAAIDASYEVRAAVVRLESEGRREALSSGARLRLGDRLAVEFHASRELWVYVINEDEQGRAFVLFPLPGLELQNPLPADSTRTLPGRRDGKPLSWVVDTPGGKEHLLILASPTRQIEFEAEMNLIDRAKTDDVAVSMTDGAKSRIRGIGGLAPVPGTTRSDRLFDMARQLAGATEVVEGVWLRQIELENP
ncbi:MAG: protein kinase [bacterium]|nr:protein kinase [bacterium]